MTRFPVANVGSNMEYVSFVEGKFVSKYATIETCKVLNAAEHIFSREGVENRYADLLK